MTTKKFFIICDADGDHEDSVKYDTKAEAIEAARMRMARYDDDVYYILECVACVKKALAPVTVIDI